MTINLKQLAERLGLSQTTVSRALNGYSDVGESTRRRVAEEAARLGYAPSAMARRLAMGKSDAIGLIYPLEAAYLGDPRFLEVLEGITERLDEARMDVLVASAGRNNELESYKRLIRTQRVDGFIVARTHLDDARIRFLRQAKFPFISYGRTNDAAKIAWFDFDNELGGNLAGERLLALGHRRIGYIHAPLDLTFAAQRHRGFVTALRAGGIDADPALMREAGFSRRAAYAAINDLLRLPDRPTAVVIDNNQAGVGAIRAVLEAGLRLGRDCSLIVYDGLPEDTLIDQKDITSIEQPTPHAAGRQLAELMLDVLQGAPPATLQVLWQPLLRLGRSDGPAAIR